MQVDPRRPQRQDTYDLRDQMSPEERQQALDNGHYGAEDEERSVLEDDSEQEDGDDFMDDDMSSTLSIPNEAIDFDMVYALHSFAATVEGQANVVKGDSLYLMDDSNSYWWLVRVLKTQEVGYIPAENIETPFERLARLNKHRNIDLASATPAEQSHGSAQEQALLDIQRSNNGELPPRVRGPNSRNIHFSHIRSNYHYIPPLRDGEEEDEEDEWEVGGFEDEDPRLIPNPEDEDYHDTDADDSMQWEDAALDEPPQQTRTTPIPDALLPASHREQEKQRMLRVQQQQQLQQQQQQQQERLAQEQEQQRQLASRSQAAPAGTQELQESGSRERIAQEPPVDSRRVDPAEVTETFKLTATPTIAREYDDGAGNIADRQREEERLKRQREEEEEAAKRSKGEKPKMAPPVSSTTYNKGQPPGKLRKEPSKEKDRESDTDSKDKKKKSMFGSLWSRKKDKPKDKNGSIGSVDSNEYLGRTSEDSGPGARPADGASPTTAAAQQQQHALRAVSSNDFGNPQTPERIQVSQHANSLRQRDEQQMKLYQQQYLTRSPSSPPEASLSSSIAFSPSNSGLGPPAQRPRPGSLILTSPSSNDIQANLNVIRVFAGKHLQTDATFKTVLLNPNTTASDLIRQALQRFRLPSAEDEGDYYLTVKQVEGGAFTILQGHEKPLVVFETLVSEAELPKVKRSSVGSISSISSNLSMHPAIKKLSMNDFTDDSAVKFYLNRRGAEGSDDSMTGHEGDDTIIADTSHADDGSSMSSPRSQTSNLGGVGSPGVGADRFTSPSIRFPLQLVIYAEDLPDDMQFHPETEAIVFKHSLPNAGVPVVVSPTLRRKVFIFPKNITVAEVTEIGLERFGIQDGVVDGGDEVEDKATKRRSVVRVRYGLTVAIDGHERELAPSSKIVDAFPRPPAYRQTDRQQGMNKRRSLDAAQLLGNVEDIRKDDPVFVLRRATSYRSSTSRRRMSAPLDEIALQHLHRESMSSYNSDQNVANATLSADNSGTLKQPSRQEIIAAQRAATRATQRAIVTTQSNSVRGMDVLLPGNAMLRSSRYDADNRMRYSYVEADGETYDVSDIIEEEWGSVSDRNDLLEGVVDRNKDGIGEKLDRVLHKIRKGKGREKPLGYTDSVTSSNDADVLQERSASPSEYSGDEGDSPPHVQSRTMTPLADMGRTQTPRDRPGTTTPTMGPPKSTTPAHSRRNPSVASVQSNYSSDHTSPPATQGNFVRQNAAARVAPGSRNQSARPSPTQQVIIPRDDFGLSQMMAIIDLKASAQAGAKPNQPELDPVDEMLFGAPIDLESLHPQIREIYAGGFKQLEDIDKVLDSYIARSVVGAF